MSLRKRKLGLPPYCLSCQDSLQGVAVICQQCNTQLPWLEKSCRQCALPLTSTADICGQCLQQPPYFDQTQAVFRYQDEIRDWVTQAKFYDKLYYWHELAKLLSAKLSLFDEKPQLLIPVPSHAKRIRERGYQQSLEFAKQLSKQLNIPLSTAAKRTRYTAVQTELTSKQRRSNCRNAFQVTMPLPENIAIIDDVVTTGATVNELAKACRAQGAKHIAVWCVARTVFNV